MKFATDLHLVTSVFSKILAPWGEKKKALEVKNGGKMVEERKKKTKKEKEKEKSQKKNLPEK